jgi:hypothetical protein
MEALHQNTTLVLSRVMNMTSVCLRLCSNMAAKENYVRLKSGHPSPTGTLTVYLLFLSNLKIATTTDSDGIRKHGGKEIAGSLK